MASLLKIIEDPSLSGKRYEELLREGALTTAAGDEHGRLLHVTDFIANVCHLDHTCTEVIVPLVNPDD